MPFPKFNRVQRDLDLYLPVIYMRMVARKIRLTRRFSLFCLLNKWNIWLAGRGLSIWRQAVALIWLDGVVRWCSQAGWWFNWRETSAWPIYMFSTSNTGSRKYYLLKKMIGWKIDPFFFITENFLGIFDRLYTEPTCRSHDFLSLTLPVAGSTSGSCYFLLQCRCLWVCVLWVLVVRCLKS